MTRPPSTVIVGRCVPGVVADEQGHDAGGVVGVSGRGSA
jgi:hypothetical protein